MNWPWTLLSFLLRHVRCLTGMAFVCTAGLVAVPYLRNSSVDLFFVLRGPLSTNHADVVLVFMESGPPGDWSPYARLLTNCTALGARAVVFDLAFTNAAWDSGASVLLSSNDLRDIPALAATLTQNPTSLQQHFGLSLSPETKRALAQDPSAAAADLVAELNSLTVPNGDPNIASAKDIRRRLASLYRQHVMPVNPSFTNLEHAIAEAVHRKTAVTFGVPYEERADPVRAAQYRELIPCTLASLEIEFASSGQFALGGTYLKALKPSNRVYTYADQGLTHASLAHSTLRLVTNRHAPASFFLNYYGPAGTLPSLQAQQLPTAEVAQEAPFAGRIVFVGDGPARTTEPRAPDRHGTPFARSPDRSSSGVEIQATALADLKSAIQITDCGVPDMLLVLLCGVAAGHRFVRWTPQRALAIGAACSLAIVAIAFAVFAYAHWYAPWIVLAFVQMPVAVAVSWLPVKSVFISHRARDADTVYHIADGLERCGVEVYYDLTKGEVGELRKGLLMEVEQRGTFLLVVTSNVVSSLLENIETQSLDWVGEEVARATWKGKPILLVTTESISNAPGCEGGPASWPGYQARHSPYEFSFESLWKEQARTSFSLQDRTSSIFRLWRQLPWGIRRRWGRRRFLSAYELSSRS